MNQSESISPIYLGKWVQSLRKKRKITLRTFCRALQCSPAAWCRAERGVSRAIFRPKSFGRLAQILQLPPEDKKRLDRLRRQEIIRPLIREKQVIPLFFNTDEKPRKAPQQITDNLSSWEPPALSPAEIACRAFLFRQTHFPARFPLDLEAAIEFELKMDLVILPEVECVPGGKAFINADCTHLFIQRELFENPRHSGQLRFVLAHELGHLALHKDLDLPLALNSPEDYFEFILGISDHALYRLEWQAHRFAGALLAPRGALENALRKQLNIMTGKRFVIPGAMGKNSLKVICRNIAPLFGVTSKTVEIRLTHERLWPPLY